MSAYRIEMGPAPSASNICTNGTATSRLRLKTYPTVSEPSVFTTVTLPR